jgi:hypothetical protein
VLDQNPVLDANDVGCDPVHRLAEARKPSMDDYKISIGHNRSWFILQCWRDALNEVEQALATRRDVSTVLDVFGRLIALSCYVVTLVEQCVESFKDKRFVFLFN